MGRTHTTKIKNSIFAFLGILRGDVLTFEETRDIRRGKIVRYYNTKAAYIARFVEFADGGFVVADADGEDADEDFEEFPNICRLIAVTRAVPRPDPATDAAPTDNPAPVIDLLVWRQAHPRKVRRLLFAEKKGGPRK